MNSAKGGAVNKRNSAAFYGVEDQDLCLTSEQESNNLSYLTRIFFICKIKSTYNLE